MTTPITIRPSTTTDTPVLRRLAELDSAPPMSGPALIAEVGDRAVAALNLRDGRAISDPFEPTQQIVALLRAASEAA